LLLSLIPSLWFLSLLWQVDQRKRIPCFFPSFGSFMLEPLVCLYPARPKNFFCSYGDHPTAKNPSNVLVHLVQRGHGTLQLVEHPSSLVCHSFWCPVSYHGVWLDEVDHLASLLSTIPPSLGSRQLQWSTDWERPELLFFLPSHSFLFLSISMTLGLKSHESWCMLKMS
jgi:hypothetical protein